MIDPQWLNIPLEIQVILVSGYAAYWAAYGAFPGYQQALDSTFSAIIFGIIATIVMIAIPASHPIITITIAFFAALAAGFGWRLFLKKIWVAMMRHVGIWRILPPRTRDYKNEKMHSQCLGRFVTREEWLQAPRVSREQVQEGKLAPSQAPADSLEPSPPRKT